MSEQWKCQIVGKLCDVPCAPCPYPYMDRPAVTLQELAEREGKMGYLATYAGPYFTPQVWATIPMAKKEEWWRLTEYGKRAPSPYIVAWMVQP